MATTIQREAIVGPGGAIQVNVPELQPGQRVTVTIQPQVESQGASTKRRHVIDIVQDLPGHRVFKTAEEVDEYIREERDSWER